MRLIKLLVCVLGLLAQWQEWHVCNQHFPPSTQECDCVLVVYDTTCRWNNVSKTWNSKDHLAFLRTGTGLNTLKKEFFRLEDILISQKPSCIFQVKVWHDWKPNQFLITWDLLFFTISFTFLKSVQILKSKFNRTRTIVETPLGPLYLPRESGAKIWKKYLSLCCYPLTQIEGWISQVEFCHQNCGACPPCSHQTHWVKNGLGDENLISGRVCLFLQLSKSYCNLSLHVYICASA